MTEAEKLERISISEQAGRLSEPFTMIDLVQIDDLVLSIYLCKGTMPLHRHLDQDELFLVHSGTISLESEWGDVVLRPGELAVAPKGVGHRSSSIVNSQVLLLQPRLMVNRRNGNRRLFAVQGDGRLEKISVPALGRQIVTSFKPVVVVHLDTFALHLVVCEGTGPWWRGGRQASLALCYEGRVTVDCELGQVALGKGELVVLPKGINYRLSGTRRSLIMGLSRHRQPGLPLSE